MFDIDKNISMKTTHAKAVDFIEHENPTTVLSTRMGEIIKLKSDSLMNFVRIRDTDLK